MNLSFRQGLVSFQSDFSGGAYLQATPTGVSLVVSPTPLVLTAAHHEANYLITLDVGVVNAWNGLPSAVTCYLYVDIDLLTAQPSFGFTLTPCNVSTVTPSMPATGLHWFNPADAVMAVYEGVLGWQEKVRVFVGERTSAGDVMHYPRGSMVGLTEPSKAGHILLDQALRPVRLPNGRFLTTLSPLRARSGSLPGVVVMPLSDELTVRAGENIPARSVVYLAGSDVVRLAPGTPAAFGNKVPVGLIVDDLSTNELGTMIMQGEVSSDAFNWEGHAGKPLYCTSLGELTVTRPEGYSVYRVGFVKSDKSIIFSVDTETVSQTYVVSANNLLVTTNAPLTKEDEITLTGDRSLTLSITPASALADGAMTAAMVNQLGDHETRLDTTEADVAALVVGKASIGHTHSTAEVTGLSSALALKADVTHSHSELAPVVHSHPELAPVVHSHLPSDVTGLDPLLAAKAQRTHLNSFDEVFAAVNRSGPTDMPVGQSLDTALNARVLKAGDSMTGNLTISAVPSAATHAVTKGYVDARVLTVRDEGAPVDTLVTSLNFTGAAVVTPDTPGSVSVSIPGLGPHTHPYRIVATAGPSFVPVLQDGDGQTLIRRSHLGNAYVTIPEDGTLNFPIGSMLIIEQTGMGQVELAPALGVTCRTPTSLRSAGQWSRVYVIKVGPNEWSADGRLEPDHPYYI